MGKQIQFDYYYGIEAEQFSFYRVPRLLIKDERFKGLSSDAKLLYGLMLDRMSLSMKNGWLDEENRAYIIYTLDTVMEDLGCAKATCVKIMKELDSDNGIGLIEKKRRGLGKPDIIYVKNFATIGEAEEETPANADVSTEVQDLNLKSSKSYTSRSSETELQEVQKADFQKSKNFTSRSTISELAEVQKADPNYTNYNHTNQSNIDRNYINPINQSGSELEGEIDVMEDVNAYMEIIIPIGGRLFLNGSITASIFLLFAYIGSLYLSELLPLQQLSMELAQSLNGVKKAKQILDLPIFDSVGDFPKSHDVTLKSVRFSYDGKTDVLTDCDLHVAEGEKVAIVGASGAGKTTVIELISRFYDVTDGEVLIGGQNIKDIAYEKLLNNISIVFQKTFLTRDSVLENIRMGSNATLEEVRAAAKEAQIDDFIMSLPDGYDTKVGSFGSRFSGGEKQRIAIARAILKNAPILILDEATSAADPENQVEIDMAISNLCKGKTVLIVAHRLGAIKMCDKVAVVENHTITAFGTHEEVLEENHYYQRAWERYHAAREVSYSMKGVISYESK